MMLFTLLLLSSPIIIENTEIFQAPNQNNVKIHPNGSVYILNFGESRIQHYDRGGHFIRHIGRRGKGPGEFTFPTQFRLFDNRLYIFDLLEGQLSVFDADGSFIERFAIPEGDVELVKVKGGWVVGTWGIIATNGPAKAFWTDNRFQERIDLFEIEQCGYAKGSWVIQDDGKSVGFFSKLSTTPQLYASPDGQRAYLCDPKGFKIHMIDAKARRIVGEITRQDRPIPFDTEWGSSGADENRKRFRKEHPNLLFKINTPEYFPAIREILFDPDGRLIVNRWRGRPDRFDHAIAIDEMGRELPANWSWQALSRILGVVGESAYVSMFEANTEEAAIALIPLSEVEEFVRNHPLSDAEASHRIRME